MVRKPRVNSTFEVSAFCKGRMNFLGNSSDDPFFGFWLFLRFLPQLRQLIGKLPQLQFQLGDPGIKFGNLVKGDNGQNKSGK